MALFEATLARAARLGPNRAASAIAFAAIVALMPLPMTLVAIASMWSLDPERRDAIVGALCPHARPLVEA